MTESPSPLTMLFSRHTKRRTFIAGFGSAAAWPVMARAQQGDRVRRIGVMMLAADNPEMRRRAAFVQGLQELGWTDGRNVRIDTRSAGVNVDDIRKQAAELVALAPDVILASGGENLGPLL